MLQVQNIEKYYGSKNNVTKALDRVSAGSILLDGVRVDELSEAELARFRRERLGFVFQDFNLLDTLDH